MALWKPDPSFYPSPKMAMQAPPERHAYVAALNYGRNDQPDAICVVDLDESSDSYGTVLNKMDLPDASDAAEAFVAALDPDPVFLISAKENRGIKRLLSRTIELLDKSGDDQQDRIASDK